MLTSKVTKRVPLPHEDGEWVDVRMPNIRIIQDAQRTAGDDGMALSLALLKACVVAWSYEEPVTPENVADLDLVTVNVVGAALMPAQTEADRGNG